MTILKNQLYSIKDLENFTQIKAHTLRIWEQRYNLLNPKRTESNIRYYEEADLKKILNVKLLYSNGFKISKIGSFSDEKIIEETKQLIRQTSEQAENKWINDVILLILEFNGDKITSKFKKELKNSDLMSLYMNKVIPLLRLLGELWQVSTIEIIHEHYFSNIYREFVISQIHKIKLTKKSTAKAVLFLHGTEEHEFSILMYYYLLKKAGYVCYYFGQKTPAEEIEEIQKLLNPEVIVTTFTSQLTKNAFQRIKDVLTRLSLHSKVIISGSQLAKMNADFSENIHYIHTSEELEKLIKLSSSH